MRRGAQKGTEPHLGVGWISGQKVKPVPVLLPSMEFRTRKQHCSVGNSNQLLKIVEYL